MLSENLFLPIRLQKPPLICVNSVYDKLTQAYFESVLIYVLQRDR
jgi:hypothetical protein